MKHRNIIFCGLCLVYGTVLAGSPEPIYMKEMPALAKSSQLSFPKVHRDKLYNGISVLWIQDDKIPAVYGQLRFLAGMRTESVEHMGLSQLTSSMLMEGYGDKTAAQLSQEMDQLGSDLSTAIGDYGISYSFSSLKDSFGETIALLSDLVQHPRWDQGSFDRLHSDQVQNVAYQRTDPDSQAFEILSQELYGKHWQGFFSSGTPASVKNLSLDQVKKYYGDFIRPEQAVLTIVGDLQKEDLLSSLNQSIGSWKVEAKYAMPEIPGLNEIPKFDLQKKVAIYDRPEAVQTVIVMGKPVKGFAKSTYPKARLIDIVIGGSFTSVLNQNLREKHGYTYSARSSSWLHRQAGFWMIQTSVKSDTTGKALEEIYKEFTKIQQKGFSKDQIQKGKKLLQAQLVESVDSFEDLNNQINATDLLGIPTDFYFKVQKKVNRLTPKRVKKVAKQMLDWKDFDIVLVGDRKSIEAQLKDIDPQVISEKPIHTAELRP
ncbi:MAG: insulinase family protein [Bdellovibrionales bacterium]|nr:insulinase family protein [Bdellovibrionales bacterium]